MNEFAQLRAPGSAAALFPTLRVTVSPELLTLAAALYIAVFCNSTFWTMALAGRDPLAFRTGSFALALLILLIAVPSLPMILVLGRRTLKPVLATLILCAALAAYFIDSYGTRIDPTMLRNALHTNFGEATELLVPRLWVWLALIAGPPLFLLTRVEIPQRPLHATLRARLGSALALALGVLLLLVLAYQDIAAFSRNHRDLRYLAVPGNFLYSLARNLGQGAHAAQRTALRPVGVGATLGEGWIRRKSTIFVLVIGETARAANWGLSGYHRQTTPELAQWGVINYPHVRACGTNTEISVPCMFSAVGRRDYDEDRIRGSEGLLDVFARAGFRVAWVDNQSGCKGVCDRIGETRIRNLDAREVQGLCNGDHCFDEALLVGLEKFVKNAEGRLLVVLHMIGNHGPAYFRRYPQTFRKFLPDCRDADLTHCSDGEIVNAYDNALLYTDHVLARILNLLDKVGGHTNAGMLYVSDHGESLGEKRLYLHGLPYAIAPREQTEVPMALWLSKGFATEFNLEPECLRKGANDLVSHDSLFHSLLGLLDVRSPEYDLAFDLTAPCKRDSGA